MEKMVYRTRDRKSKLQNEPDLSTTTLAALPESWSLLYSDDA